jgi:hypothetical protein
VQRGNCRTACKGDAATVNSRDTGDATPARDASVKACVSFSRNDRSPERKTDVWEAWSLRDAKHIGQVRWHSSARGYCFSPSSGIALYPDCLRSIAAFVESETEMHRKGKRAFREA